METMRSDFEPDVDLGQFVPPPEGGTFFGELPLPMEGVSNPAPVEDFDPQHKEAVEGLLWLGYLTSTFTLHGHKFTIKTLTRGERLAVTQVAKPYEETLGLAMAITTATVAACLVMVDDQPFNPSLGPVALTTRIEDNFRIISDWYDPVIEGIVREYNNLTIKQTAAFTELQSK